MKRSRIILGISVALSLGLTACGKKAEQEQAEAVDQLQEAFAVDSAVPPPHASGSSGSSTSTGGAFSSGGTSLPSSREETRAGPNSSETVKVQTPDGKTMELPVVVQQSAQEAVSLIRSGRYAEAVLPLYRLASSDHVTPAQRTAARRAWLRLEHQVLNDPDSTEEELRMVQEARSPK